MRKEEFVRRFYKYAKKAERKTGVPALFALAQSALESGWGSHAPGNMLFGIKRGSGKNYGGWSGQSQLLTTTEYSEKPDRSFPHIFPGYPILGASGKWKYKVKDHFRAYSSPFHAFMDWAGLLSGASRYRFAMQNRSDPYRFADQVAKAGYATAPSYAGKVKGVMNEIARIIRTKGVKTNPWKIILPVGILIAAGGLIIYGSIAQAKASRI